MAPLFHRSMRRLRNILVRLVSHPRHYVAADVFVPVPAQYTSSHNPSTNVHYSQQATHEQQRYHPPDPDNDKNNESSSSSGSDDDDDDDEEGEDEGEDEDNEEENERPPPSTSAGPSRPGFPISSSRYEGR